LYDNQITQANKAGTDWFHEIFKPAPIQSHNVSVSAGGDRSSFFFSLGYFNQQGTLEETYLKRYDGIGVVNVNYRTKETTVKYYTDRINIEEIKTAIANAGYDADDVPANPDSYNRLPITCKKPEDGGHQKKH